MDDSLLGRYILTKLDEMTAVVAEMDDATANQVPDLPGANSAYQLLVHCLGMARQWVGQNILGEPTGRDRAAEFEASGSVAELLARAEQERARLVTDLGRIDPGMPVPGRPGNERFWVRSAEGILLHVLEELCQHLGHLEITRDLVAAGRETGGRAVSPLLEFDPERRAFIEPSDVKRLRDVPQACVLTWFHDAVDRMVERLNGRRVVKNGWEDGPHPLYEVEIDGQRVGLAPMPVSGAAAGSMVEELFGFGCRSFVACGGAGGLRPDLTLGHLIVVTSALRDEGLSHHYLPPSRVVESDPAAVAVLKETLTEHGVPFVAGRTWTTDAFFRETPGKIAARREEGCVTVEMEAASIAAVAQFREAPLAQLLYSGDDLSGETWDHRAWQTQHEVRDNMLELAIEAALRVEAQRVEKGQAEDEREEDERAEASGAEAGSGETAAGSAGC